MNGVAEFFKQYDGRRIDVTDNQPIERGMTTRDLCDWLARYHEMLTSGARPNGAQLTANERTEVTTQTARLRAELNRRSQPEQGELQ